MMDPPYAKCSSDPTGLSTRAPQAFCEYHPRIFWTQSFPAITAYPEVRIPRILHGYLPSEGVVYISICFGKTFPAN